MKENNLKILMITEQNPFVRSDASSNRFLSLVEGMAENGVNIDIFFIGGYINKFEKKLFKSSGVYKSINYKYLVYFNYGSFINRNVLKRILPKRYYVEKITESVKQNKYDFVWLSVSDKTVKIGIELFKKKINVKYIHERSEFSWIGFSGKEKLHKVYLTQFLPHIDYFAIMTQTLIKYYKAFVSEKTKILHLPMTVDFSRFEGKIQRNDLKKPYIAYCGTMDIKKDGVDILIQSFKNIMDEFPDLHLYLAGPLEPKNDYQYLNTLIVNKKMKERIIFLGSVPREKIPEFLLNSDILAMARPESKQAEGGFPTKLGEYLATGKPVCVTRVGEIANYLVDNESAFISEPGSVEAFTKSLLRALKSDRSKEIGLAGRKVALKHFNKDIQSKNLIDFLTFQ